MSIACQAVPCPACPGLSQALRSSRSLVNMTICAERMLSRYFAHERLPLNTAEENSTMPCLGPMKQSNEASSYTFKREDLGCNRIAWQICQRKSGMFEDRRDGCMQFCWSSCSACGLTVPRRHVSEAALQQLVQKGPTGKSYAERY